MVDIPKITGSVNKSGVLATGKEALERHQKAKQAEKKQKSEPKDEVVLSKEALDRTHAEQTSKNTRSILENSNHTLAPAGSFSEKS